jgi:hypothetical protein
VKLGQNPVQLDRPISLTPHQIRLVAGGNVPAGGKKVTMGRVPVSQTSK